MNIDRLIYTDAFIHDEYIRVEFDDVRADFELGNSNRFGMNKDPFDFPEEYAFAKILQLRFTPGLDELDDTYIHETECSK